MNSLPESVADDQIRAARHRLLTDARFEIIPTPNAADLTRSLPVGTTVHVMCPPLQGEQTGSVRLKGHLQGSDSAVDVAVKVAALGHRAVPHVTAKTVRSREHLRELLKRMNDAGIDEGFFPGGDGVEPVGPYSSAVELLDDLAGMDHHLRAIGIGAYPEGHHKIPPDVLLEALLHKQSVATFICANLCFDPEHTVSWLRTLRANGVHLPLNVGAPGAIRMGKLLKQLKHWGAASAVRFLRKQHGMASAILKRNFSPSTIFEGMAAASAADADLGIGTIQLVTLNDVAATEAWRSKALANNGEYDA